MPRDWRRTTPTIATSCRRSSRTLRGSGTRTDGGRVTHPALRLLPLPDAQLRAAARDDDAVCAEHLRLDRRIAIVFRHDASLDDENADACGFFKLRIEADCHRGQF